jgi:hypothetical protein
MPKHPGLSMAVSIEGKYTGLRARLVIENETISGHCDRVAALRAEFPHTIRCIGQPVDGTCVPYAFGLLDGTPRLVAELEGLGVKAGGAFVQWLMDEEHLVEIETARTNGLALYFDQGSWKHVGIMNDGDRVTSKWGTYGVFDHRLSEVPGDYGNQVRFFELPSTVVAACLLFRFACSKLALKPQEIDRLREITGMSE